MIETIKRRGKSLLYENKALTALFAIIFAVMLIFSLLSPLAADDYTYCFSFATGERISNISMIIESMVAHRSSMNGRVISHGLVQLLLMLPKPIFDVFNALNATLIFYFIYWYTRKTDSASSEEVS